MPIVYEPAAPVAAYGRLGELTARNNLGRLAAAAGGGGRVGGSGFQQEPYDTGIQAAISNRDNMEFRRSAAQSEGVVTPAQAFAAQADLNRQQSGYALQAELQTLQLSQQEAMRLSRMKNAIGEVSADPTLSADEKADMIAQLRTGISPLEQRAAKARVAAETQEREQRASLYQEQAALRHQEALVTAKTAKDRTSFIPDPQALAQIAEDFRSNMPGAVPEGTIAQMAEAEALRQGLGTHVFQEGYGKFQILKGDGAPGARGGERGERGGGADHPTGLSPEAYLKLREQVVARIDYEARETVAGADGLSKEPRYPDLGTADGYNRRLDGALKAAGLPTSLTEYNAQRQATERRGYKSPFAAREQPKAEAASTPAPGPQGAAQKAVPFTVGALEQKGQALAADAGLSADEKTAGQMILSQIKDIATRHPDPKAMPLEVRQQLLALGQNYEKLKQKMKGPVTRENVREVARTAGEQQARERLGGIDVKMFK